MTNALTDIFYRHYRELRPRTSLPDLAIEFYPFASINNTIRLREGKLLVRLSDILQGAPENVLEALAHILLAKMYRKEIACEHASRYRRYVCSHDITEKAQLLRQIRGRKRIASAQGQVYDLESVFDNLNLRFFHGLLARPQISWSRDRSRRRLGHYDPAHNTIVVSRVFDDCRIPLSALEYLVYHEMLHLKHPVRLRGSRRCVHSREFHAEEKLFPGLRDVKCFLKQM